MSRRPILGLSKGGKKRETNKFLSDVSHRYWFFAGLILGGGSIVQGSYADWSQWNAMAVPSVVIIIYALLAFRKAQNDASYDQMGDNCYYLGFMLTLIALSISLIRFGADGGSLGDSGLVARFGISLLTTLLGLGARLIFIQFRLSDEIDASVDPEERLRSAIFDLSSEVKMTADNLREAGRGFSGGIQEIGTDLRALMKENAEDIRAGMVEFKSARGDILRSINTGATQSVKRMEETTERNIQSSEMMTKEAFGRMEMIIDNLEKRFSQTDIDPNVFVRPIEEAVSSFRDEIGLLNQAIEKAVGSSHNLDEKWSATSDGLGELANMITLLSDAMETLNQRQNDVVTFSNSTRQVIEALRQQQTDATAFSETIREATDRQIDLAKLVENFGANTEGMRESNEAAAGLADSIHQAAAHQDQITEALATWKNLSAGLLKSNVADQEELSEAKSRIAAEVDTLSEAISMMIKNLVEGLYELQRDAEAATNGQSSK
jgi:methyl-accepting chemotaxis protein